MAMFFIFVFCLIPDFFSSRCNWWRPNSFLIAWSCKVQFARKCILVDRASTLHILVLTAHGIKSLEKMCKSFDLTVLLLCLRLWCLNLGICTDVNLIFSYSWIHKSQISQTNSRKKWMTIPEAGSGTGTYSSWGCFANLMLMHEMSYAYNIQL